MDQVSGCPVNDTSQPVAASRDNGIDVVGLWWIVWDHRILVALTTTVCVVVALFIALTATPIYRASVVVTETPDTGLGGDNGMGGQLGGLASLAGLALGAGGQHPERQAVLRSRNLVEQFVARPDVLPELMKKAKPGQSLWLTAERFRKSVLDIEEDKLKDTTTITIDWVDPAVAARWANEFIALANQLLRTQAAEDAARNVAYLEDQVERTHSVEIQKVMYDLIQQESQRLMLAKGRVDYAFTVDDPAVKPEMRISPRRTLLVASGLVAGMLLGCYIAWIRVRFARRALRTRG
jgi:uncharacterized protein involved in exopolysaccharide biosynthesis